MKKAIKTVLIGNLMFDKGETYSEEIVNESGLDVSTYFEDLNEPAPVIVESVDVKEPVDETKEDDKESEVAKENSEDGSEEVSEQTAETKEDEVQDKV